MKTRAYTLAELDLLPPSVVMRLIKKYSPFMVDIGDMAYALLQETDQLTIPCHAYIVAVVEHNKNTNEVIDLVKYNPQFETLSFYKKHPVFNGWDTLHTMFNTTNPFLGLTNPDGTQRTSCTRDELEAWKRGEVK